MLETPVLIPVLAWSERPATAMRVRFYVIDGRVAEDGNLDPRTRRHLAMDGGQSRWFAATEDTDVDGLIPYPLECAPGAIAERQPHQ